ncbi:hypothetical protein ACWD3D_36455, partial [Streptomyces sp. NPDC002690]
MRSGRPGPPVRRRYDDPVRPAPCGTGSTGRWDGHAPTAGAARAAVATKAGTLGVQRFGYAGCSIGGAIGADLALRHPHRVAS